MSRGCYCNKIIVITITKEPANKSSVFPAGTSRSQMRERLRRKCLDLFKRPDKAVGLASARPSGLSERPWLSVNDFRQTTSMAVIVALIPDRSDKPGAQGTYSQVP